MTIQQNFYQRPKSFATFAGTGVIVTGVPTTMCNNLQVVVENVGVTNAIVVKGKLDKQSAYQTLSTITGATTGTTVDISKVESYEIECTTYSASGGTPTLIASAVLS